MVGCAVEPVKPLSGYHRAGRNGLYQLTAWSFDGRVAIVHGEDADSANIRWMRRADEEKIRLSGPLGQGAVVIHIGREFLSIDRGEGEIKYRGREERSVTEQLGFYAPFRSLRYWVLGLVDPDAPFQDVANGFVQKGWTVTIDQMQMTALGVMPRKVEIKSDAIKLKFIMDHWRKND